MKLRTTKFFANAIIVIIIITILTEFNNSISSTEVNAISDNIKSDQSLVIDTLSLEAERNGRFTSLDDFIPEITIAKEQENLPKIKNGTYIRINASYSTAFGLSNSLVIHEFALDIYKIVSAGNHTLYDPISLSTYYNPDLPQYKVPELVLSQNSSKSEVIPDILVDASEYGAYKFVFRVKYHIEGKSLDVIDTYYHQNYSFELVYGYGEPPFIIIYVFIAVVIIFMALVILGIYGDRKYREPE